MPIDFQPSVFLFQQAVDFANQFQQFVRIFLDCGLCAEVEPEFSRFALHGGVPRPRYIIRRKSLLGTKEFTNRPPAFMQKSSYASPSNHPTKPSIPTTYKDPRH